MSKNINFKNEIEYLRNKTQNYSILLEECKIINDFVLVLAKKDCTQEEFETCMAIFYLKKLNRNNRNMYSSQIVENILAKSFTFHEFDEVAVEMVKYMANK